jgi:membrane peptidoglycan carboxypeptidase
MKSSFIDYFEKIAPDTMDVPHALFMIKLLYDNNKNYYPEHEIKVENILDMMIANGYVPENLREDVLAEYKKVKANAKLPRTSFSIYLDRLFLAGYDHFPESYDITVKSTFSNSLQNTLSSMLADQLKRNNIPEGSAIVIQNNQLIVGLTITLVDGRMYYENSYPNAFAYNSIKPFMYLTLLDNRKDVPSQLLSFDKQNLIFSNKRIEQFIKPVINPNLVITEDSPKMTVKELETIESQNLAIMPSGIRKLLAEKLSYLENNFFAEVPAKNYEAMLNRLRITPYEVPVAMPDLLSGDIRVNLFDLARAYTAFQAEPTIVNSGIIDTINGVAEEQYKAQELLSIRKTFTNLLKNIYFNTISTPNGQQFYIMIDFQTAIIFNNDYVVALWLGDLSGDKKFKDTTENLEILVRNVLNLLQQ